MGEWGMVTGKYPLRVSNGNLAKDIHMWLLWHVTQRSTLVSGQKPRRVTLESVATPFLALPPGFCSQFVGTRRDKSYLPTLGQQDPVARQLSVLYLGKDM